MAENKTQPTALDPRDFITRIIHDRRRRDGLVLMDVFARVTGFEPRMWGPSIIGYGRYHYVYASGREGDHLATGFSPRKAAMSVYIMPGYTDFGEILGRLGKYKNGKSCLYINNLDDIDLGVLEELIAAGLKDLDARWKVHPV